MSTSQPAPSTEGGLARCVGDAEAFLTDAWGRRPHLHRGGPADDLLSLDAVDHLITSTALRAPAFRLVKGGDTLAPWRVTRTGRVGSRQIDDLVDPVGVAREFADGATIVLQGLHRYWPPVTALCRRLEAELTHPVQANAYLTPPGSQGLRVHADGHDVFAIQSSGRKEWVLHEDGADAPATQSPTLVPGDALYVPKGTAHAARTVAEASLHLTIGIRRFTWADALRPAVTQLLDSPELDAALPVGFANDPVLLSAELADRLRELAAAVEKRDPTPLAEGIVDRFWSTRLAPAEGQLLQVLALEDIADETWVSPRPWAHVELDVTGDAAVLHLAGRRIRFPARVAGVLRQVLDAPGLRVGDLTALDASSRLVLVKRLVREGVLVVDTAAGERPRADA